jgi:hypothetical protein
MDADQRDYLLHKGRMLARLLCDHTAKLWRESDAQAGAAFLIRARNDEGKIASFLACELSETLAQLKDGER